MISRYTQGSLVWIDLASPTREELLHINEEFGLSKDIEEALFSPTPLHTVDVYDKCIYLTLPCPAMQGKSTTVSTPVLRAIIGKKYLITVREYTIEAIQAFGDGFEHVETPDGTALFAELMKHVYTIAVRDLERISSRMRTIEQALLSNDNEQLLKGIFQTDRMLLSFKHAIAEHALLLEAYASACMQRFGEEAFRSAEQIRAEYSMVYNTLESQSSIMSSIHQVRADHLISKNNAQLKTLIILSSIIIVLITATLII